jgi:hypothetical protein
MEIIRVSAGKIAQVYEKDGRGQISEMILAAKEIYFHHTCLKMLTGIDMKGAGDISLGASFGKLVVKMFFAFRRITMIMACDGKLLFKDESQITN